MILTLFCHSQLFQVNLRPADFHGEWNYEIIPNPQ